MTKNPTTCAPATSLRLVAQLMLDHDCAAIPVVESGRLAGIVTDRDITCRGVARGVDTANAPAARVMSPCVIAVGPDEPLDKAISLMEQNALHHLAVIDAGGALLGVLAQSDIGRRITNREFGELARKTSIRDRRNDRENLPLVRRN